MSSQKLDPAQALEDAVCSLAGLREEAMTRLKAAQKRRDKSVADLARVNQWPKLFRWLALDGAKSEFKEAADDVGRKADRAAVYATALRYLYEGRYSECAVLLADLAAELQRGAEQQAMANEAIAGAVASQGGIVWMNDDLHALADLREEIELLNLAIFSLRLYIRIQYDVALAIADVS